jgi:drug/metabolite transporter (DMT)-like permease
MTSPPAPLRQQSITPGTWALMALLALIWGGSFTANRGAVGEVGVFTTVAFRVGGAALLLWAVVLARHLRVPGGWRTIAAFGAMGVLNNVIPFTLIVWGQTHIPSGLASILNGATAIFTVALAPLFFADERLTAQRALGVLIGFAGVAVTIGLGALAALDLTSLAQLAVLAATLSYAVAGIFARKALKGLAPEVSAAGMLTGAAAVMIPLALWREGPPPLRYSPAAWASLLYLAAVASSLAYFLYYEVLRRAGAGNLSIVTLMIPPAAVLLGRFFFGEALKTSAYLGFALLALGLLLLDGRLGRRTRRTEESA